MSTRGCTFLVSTLLFAVPLAAQPIPFEICAQSTIWTRPSQQMQTQKIWNDARYKGFGRDAYPWMHDFVVIDDPQSLKVIVTMTNLAGLWTVKPLWVNKCYLEQNRGGFEWIEVLSLLHRVKGVQHDVDTYTVVAEPSGKGFQWFFIRRLNPRAVLRFVTPDGKELEVWDESAPPNRVKK
jgi:hypothetical protein